MSTWAVIGIIVLVMAVIVSNIMLLKKSANSKFSSSLTDANKVKKYEDEDEDSW